MWKTSKNQKTINNKQGFWLKLAKKISIDISDGWCRIICNTHMNSKVSQMNMDLRQVSALGLFIVILILIGLA